MDDDGTPAADCLESLLPHLDTHDFLGPAVVAEDDPGRLCFPIRRPRELEGACTPSPTSRRRASRRPGSSKAW